MKIIMNKYSVFLVLVFFTFLSCKTPPNENNSYRHEGSVNNATIVVKDYETLGIIFVKSSKIINNNGSITGSEITYEMLMLEAQKLDADDVINVRIDTNEIKKYSRFGEFKYSKEIIYNYTATALAIKYIKSNNAN